MQRALGMDMTTAPRSKSQQQLYSPSLSPAHSPAKQPQPQPQSQPPTQAQGKAEPEKISGTTQPVLPQGPGIRQAEVPRIPVVPGQREAQSQGQARPTVPQEAGRVSPHPHPSPAKGVPSTPGSGAQEQTQEGLTGKLFGFGASLLTQASTLMSVQPDASPQGQPSPSKGSPKIVFSDASKEAGPKASGTGPGPGPAPAAGGGPGPGAGAGPGPGAGVGPGPGPQTGPGSGAGPGPGAGPRTGAGPGPGTGPRAGPGPGAGVGPGASPRTGPGSGTGPRPGVGTGPKAGPGPGPASGPKSELGSGPGALSRPTGAPSPKQSKAEHQTAPKAVPKPKEVPKEKVQCPLCQAELNVGSREPSNYNTCTTCRLQVCNLCGFNPTPHLVEKNEWLCLNCQTQRLLEGSLGDPVPTPLPTPKQTPTSSPRHQPGPSPQKQKGPPAPGPGQPAGPPHTSPSLQTKHLRASEPSKPPSGPQEKKPSGPAEAKQVPKPSPLPTTLTEAPKTKDGPKRAEPPLADSKGVSIAEAPRGSEQEDPSKPYSQDLSRSPQSLSDTGYSSDGISSSQSEITGLVQQEEEQLNTAGVVKPSPPSPSELNKLESTMRPLLEAQGGAPAEQAKARPQPREEPKQRQRPRSLSITPEAFDSDEELEDILEEDEDSLEWENQRDARDAAESSDDFGSKLRHDYVEDSSEGGLSPLPTRPAGRDAEGPDEDFMRRQILEMSAEEDNLEDDDAEYDRAKYSLRKAASKPGPEQGQEPAPPKRRLPHNASTYEEELKDVGAPEPEDVAALQGGLRRFKTIELNSTNNYGREMEISQEADISLDREPELEMESLTGSPEDRSRGEYSSTLPATTPSYTSGTSPTSLSSLEEDSDSSPSRRQRLEEVKQQRKARHRSHGPLLPTIEDSSEEEELREEEELLREQEKMREVEQQRIRSTARKTKRDKEELRAQRRRERSKTPPSNLSPIEDASPTEELRQAAEMEELHRSSCSEYSPSPSLDSEAEGFEIGPSKLYKSGSEYNLPTFMSLYSPTEKTSSSTSYSSSKPLKSAEEAYEEMMRKAELLQKQQGQQAQLSSSYGGSRGPDRGQGSFEYQYIEDYVSSQLGSSQPHYEPEAADAGAVYEEILQTSQSIARMHQASSRDLAFQEKKDREDAYQEKQFLNAESAYSELMRQNGGALTPGTSPTQLAAPVSFSSDSGGSRVIPDVRVTQHFAKETQDALKLLSSPASPSSALKGVTAAFTYSKGAPLVTTVASSIASRPRVYTAATSPGGPEAPLPTTASYGSQTEEMPQAQVLPDTGGLPGRERLQSMSDSKTGAPLSSKGYPGFKSASPPLSPTSPMEGLPPAIGRMGPKSTAEFSTQTRSPLLPSDIPRSPISSTPSSMVAQGTQTPHRSSSPRLTRQQSSQESPFMVITLASDAASQTKLVNASSSTSPASSPTRHQPTIHSYSQSVQVNGTQFQQEQPLHSFPKGERTPTSSAIVPMNAAKGHMAPAMDGTAALYGWGSLPAENISLCRISSVPGTSRVEPGPKPPTSSAVDLRTAMKSTPIIITDRGMDLTSLAAEARKYCLTLDQSPGRQSTTVQPLIINLNAQEHTHTFIGTSTTVSITVASSMLVSQPKQPVVYGDPFQNRLDFGQGAGSPVCLAPVKHVEQAVQTGPYQGGPRGKPKEASSPQQTKFARYNLPNQMAPLVKKDILVTQMSATQNISIKPYPMEPSSDAYRGTPAELKAHSVPTHVSGKKPHMMMVQMDDMTAGAVTKLVKEEPTSALDLTGIKPESQVACCDVVYKFPFSSSCTGTFHPSPKMPEKNVVDAAQPSQSSLPFYGSREQDLPEPSPYREQAAVGPRLYEEQKLYSHGLMGRLYSSMSDTNLAEAGLSYYPHKSDQFFQPPGGDSAMDLTTMKHSYSIGFDGRYLPQGMQYGSFTDLRQAPDLMGHPLPMRRYSSASNIYSDYRYSPRGDLSGFQESNLAQYSATTAREISRMCAALNSMDQYGGRHSSSPELLQYGPRPGPGPGPSASAQQGLAAIKPNMMMNPNFPEGRQSFGKLAQYSPAIGQGAGAIGQGAGAIRQLFPSTATVRAADGMIYSTINTPIASTLPITTQPASVLRPMVRGIYRPYGPGSITPVPLASLTRVPVVAPRVPLMPQGLYRYPAPSRFPAITTAPGIDGPLYLGKAGPATTVAGSSMAPGPAGKPVVVAAAGGLQRTEQPLGSTREEPPAAASVGPKEAVPAPSQLPGQKQPGEVTILSKVGGAEKEEKEEERQRKQQEHLLQMERERVELEKLRQLRLHEELERERVELQRHREKEQMLVQREIQELQTIKHQVLQQQQEERQAQFALQREQLAQQRLQLEQIQQLQQQLQHQLEEQKRQKAPFPPVCDPSGRLPPQAVTEIALEMQRTMAPNGQYWPPINQAFMATAAMGMEGTGQPRDPGPPRPLPSSASDMSLQTDERWEAGRGLQKRHSMPRLRDAYEMEEAHEPYVVRKITDSSVQTDEEDGEERYFMSRRRRTRRSTDCSVQTDDEDNADWEQPVRRRRTRFSRHSDSVSDSKHDSSSSSPRSKSSVGIQTISDCSVQTEPDQLLRVSPSIHITTPDPKVEIIKYISAPEKTQKGESLACQTEPEAQVQGIVVPQLPGPAAISPYTPSIQIVTTGPLEPRQQGLGKFEKKKPDPLEIGYQSHLPTESLSQLVTRQPPKSPQVLYSPVSPLSPHRLLESSFASSERLNKAHVTPQKHFTADSAQRQQTVPRPMKTMQRSLSDPKPISPTAEESAKERFSLYQQQVLQGSQMSAFQANTLIRKVKRTLPSPPPEEAHMPLPSQAHSQMYMASLLQKGLAGPPVQVTKASLLKELDRDLKLVEHESTKLRKKQAELDEEEKEIDAKLKYLELGITQRKGSLMKDRAGRDYPYLRCLGENRDYMSDSELNNLRLAGYESGAVHVRPSTAPANQYSDFAATQYTSASSYPPYQYPPGQGPPPAPTAFQHTRFQPPQYPVGSAGPTQNGFQANQVAAYPAQSTYPAPTFPPSAGYPPEHGLQGQQNFRPTPHYQPQTTYPGQMPHPPPQNALFPEPSDSHASHQKPRQTSLADLEQKVPTNYEVITAPPTVMSSAPSEPTYSAPAVTTSYDQYKAPEPPRPSDRSSVSPSPAPAYSSESLYTNLEQNIPRNYVMIDDISELTKESTPSAVESQKPEPRPQVSEGRHTKDKSDLTEPGGPSVPCCYSKGEESEEDVYDPHSADHRGKGSYHRSSESNGRMPGSGGGSSYYYGDSDYRHSSRPEKHGSSTGGPKHSSKNLAPAVISSKRSKHRKQGIEQKISKFSPIEEARDVESDLASCPTTPSVSGSMSSRGKTFQDEITYGLKKNVYEQQKYYGVSSRDLIEEDDRAYSSRSRSSVSYGSERSSHDMSSRGKSYERERESMERLQKASSKPSSLSMSQSRGRPPMRSQASEEESPISPLGRSMGGPRSSGGPLPPGAGDSCSPFCSSHSLPDVQEHIKDVPRTHSYKHEEGYNLDDSHCVVSDSEAYHLGQEETDWFDKPRESRSERLRHHGGHSSSSSSSQKRPSVKHTYHDYDEPPEEDLWLHDDGPQGRHSSKEHRHHGDYGRHSSGSSSRHQGEEPSRRVSKPHPRDSGRHEGRPHSQPSSQKKAQQADPRSQPSYPSSQSEYSQPSRQSAAYHHPPEPKKAQRPMQSGPSAQPPKSEPQQTRQPPSGPSQQPLPPQSSRQQQSRQPPPQQQQMSHGTQPTQSQTQQMPSQARLQQQQQQGIPGQPSRGQQPPAGQQAGKSVPGHTPSAGAQPAGPLKADQLDSSKPTAKVQQQQQQQGRVPHAQPQGATTAGTKMGAKTGGVPPASGAPTGQPGADGDSVFSKILPGGAAEQAGKLTEAVSAFGKKFSSFW
ncbi:protein bassoon [Notamacropus eugenii]|uniref:protein bassoon n=1 Tax=Notamacropus eugenii TaxID=9315 RepID=UPI003B67B9F2